MKNGKLKRIMSFAMSALIALGVFVPGTEIIASATIVDSGTCGENLTWTLDDEGLLTISGEGEMKVTSYVQPWHKKMLSIKSVIINDGVTNIGDCAFEDCSNLTSLTIGNSVASIGYSAFNRCTGLTSVTLSDSVVSIGIGAFYGCTSLKSIYIPNSVTGIAHDAFRNCTALKNIFLPDSITDIGEYTFAGCTSLESINIPGGVSVISNQMFRDCAALASITIPDGVTSIGYCAFDSCTSLTSVTVTDSVISIGGSAFNNCISLTNINIPNSVTSIGNNYTFNNVCNICYDAEKMKATGSPWGAKYVNKYVEDGIVYDSEEKEIVLCCSTNLKGEIVIPESVETIGYQAFRRCIGLTGITISDGVNTIGMGAFYGCTSLTRITIPDTVTSIGSYAFKDCTHLTNIYIPKNASGINGYEFSGCTSLANITVDPDNKNYSSDENGVLYSKDKTKLFKYPAGNAAKSYEIPESVRSIDAYAFSDCAALTSINIPNGVTSIGHYAFYKCSSLMSINIPDGVTSIKDHLFDNCSNLSTITIPDSITDIEYNAFYKCSSLVSINIPDTVVSIGNRAFYECASLTSINIPADVTIIGVSTFDKCTSLTNITISEGVTSIGNSAFSGCTGLESITIPDGVTSIGSSAFKDCANLTNVTVSDSVISIGDGAFYGCTGLTSVNIPANITIIDNFTFYGCVGLTDIIIPDGVTSIGQSVFYGCTGLTSIIIPDGVSTIDYQAFFYCTNLETITVPDSVSSFGSRAFDSCKNLKSIYIPDGVTSIGEQTFSSCISLTSITIPDSVTSIGKHAFSNCTGLRNVTIPDGVTSIGDYAFSGVFNICYDTEKMKATGSPWDALYVNKYYENYILYETPKKEKILSCDKNKEGEITIPNSVSEIQMYAFGACNGIMNINIPSSVKKIGYNAFQNVMNITYDPEKMLAEGSPWGAKSTSAYTEGDFVYYDNSKAMLIGCLDSESETITVPDCVEAVDCYAFTLCDNLQALSFSSSQIVFSPETLVGCPSIQTVSSVNTSGGITFTNYNPDAFSAKGGEVHYAGDNGILFADRTMSGTYSVPDSVSFICPSAFAACSELEIAIPDSVTLTSIGRDAFFNSKNYIGWGKTGTFQIGSYLIEAAKDIKSFDIPENIICIADGAFDGCLELLSVSSLGRRLLSVGKYCFRGCSKLNTVTIPDSVRYFGDSAFADTPITKSASSKVVTVGNTLISVPLSTKQYEVPGSISCIADGAFKGCELMTSVRLTGNIENLGEECFAGCLALKEITIPENVTVIGKNTFKDCVSLAEINIPEKVKKIDYTSFYGCTGITGFTVDEDNAWFAAENGLLMNKDKTELLQYPASKQGEEYIIPLKVKYIESLAFRKCLNLSRVSIPKGIKYGYKNPFENCDLENRLYNEDGFDDYNNTVYYIGGGKRELVSVTQKINGTYVIEKEVNIIRDGAFKDQTGITEIIFNDKLNVIGEEAFMGCTGLTEINIPAGVVRIEKSAFEDCVNLKKVTFGTYNSYENEALESVGEYAFANTGMTATENVFGPDESRYNKLFVETDAFHQHTPGEPEIAVIAGSTCTEEGLRHIITRCTDEKCGKVFDAKEAIPKKEHTPKEPVIENATTSSCLIEGKYDVVVYCDECGNEISRETVIVKAEGHKYIDNVTAPTCDKQGFTTHTCICGDSYVDNYTDALCHSFSYYVFNNDAKINRDGTETAKCDRCDEEDTRIAVGTAKKEAVTAIRNMEKYNDKTISYKSTITFYAKAENCTDVQWYINGQRVNANADGSCTAAKAQNNIEVFFTAKDEDGNTVKSETERITVKQGFFDKLIAFFRDLFGLLPVITQ